MGFNSFVLLARAAPDGGGGGGGGTHSHSQSRLPSVLCQVPKSDGVRACVRVCGLRPVCVLDARYLALARKVLKEVGALASKTGNYFPL